MKGENEHDKRKREEVYETDRDESSEVDQRKRSESVCSETENQRRQNDLVSIEQSIPTKESFYEHVHCL